MAKRQSKVSASALTCGPPAELKIRGARVHNLRDISLDISHRALSVITGVSGSGKSSLAFDTIYAEGQRQYIESLSTYARQFLHQLPRPDVDSIEGLQPTLCIDQRAASASPRSTVGTVTEIYDYLRLLMARVATPHCCKCGQPILQQSTEQIQSSIAALPEGTKLVMLAPVVRGRRGAHRDALAAIQKAGLVRVRVDGELYEIESVPELAVRKNHTIEAVVDKVVVRPGNESRLSESIDIALKLTDGLISISYLVPEAEQTSGPNVWQERLFSTRYACASCGTSIEEIEPRTFSFNSPYGACSACGGLGSIHDSSDAGKKEDAEWTNEFRSDPTCPVCKGSRLRGEALSVLLDGLSIADICRMSLGRLLAWFNELQLTDSQSLIAKPILSEILHRLRFLNQVGVDYLSLDRSADTLSGGELQRVRLATSIGTGLVGVCYILDEPSIGLHQRDNDRLIQSLRDLQEQGNTVIVVEHDEAMMREADLLVDMGPGAGKWGGEIVAMGRPQEVAQSTESITAKYLRGERHVAERRQRRSIDPKRKICLEGAALHNLQNVFLEVPVGLLVGITGVSGSGKSSLIGQTLVPAIQKELGSGSAAIPGAYRTLTGLEHVDKLIQLTQSPIGRTPRSTPATYCGVLDFIRQVFAGTRQAKSRGFTISRFSFNSGPGRCPQCEGQGQEKIEMNFLPDVYVCCSMCNGQRYNRQTLQIRYREKTIADVLEMSVDEAADFFDNFPKIRRLLHALKQVGLGYLTLGQSSNTLSGGEAQRIKLATELARPETGRTIYFFDEPTTGLHFEDIKRLVTVLNGLVERGNTVIVIEHNLDVIASCDWLIDLGPEGGQRGGQIVATGTPEQLAGCPGSLTGQYLSHLASSVRAEKAEFR